MKRALAFMLALTLVLSLGIGVSATGTDGSSTTPNGTITITNPTKGETYNLFKIFDATYATNDKGEILLNDKGNPTIAYTITNDAEHQFFNAMFGATPSVHSEYGQASDYFDYVASTGVVTEKKGISYPNLYKYLGWLAESLTPDASITANDEPTITFGGLETGYYLINRGTASTVTITTNTPNVKVIDKNQTPNTNDSFNKLVWDEDKNEWVENSTANIGDIITWKIPFIATNYDGDDVVKYYTIHDKKSPSLWVEFNSISITVDGVSIGKGYYVCAGDSSIDTGDWTAAKAPDVWAANKADAKWYLVHYNYDEFEIVIPWMDHYTFESDPAVAKGYTLSFDLDEEDNNNILSKSIHGSPANVEVQYKASVGPEAANGDSKNSAELDWVTTDGTFGPDDPQETVTKVYSMGITKVASTNGSTGAAPRLEGAIFELYRDKECTDPIHVIPTGTEGVYILDDVDTVITGVNRTTSREKYDEAVWKQYILDDPKPDTAETDEATRMAKNRRNDVVTPANGQVVIMGLEAGTYYVKETKAPEGYNLLAAPEAVTVGEGATSTYDNGYVVYGKTIENNSGVELPSTGGEGTVMLITFGTLIAMAFGVLMITQKKMSVYHD